MKEIIIIVGNMASGKSTVAKLLSRSLPEFNYVCLDDFRNQKAERYLEIDNRIFEDEIAEETIRALNSNHKVIYETTGGTLFFKQRFYDFVRKNRKMFIVRLKCRPSVCLSRFEKRRSGGKNHLIPIFKKQKSPAEIIDHFEKKAAWIKAHLDLDSEKSSPEELVHAILHAYPKEDPTIVLKRLIIDFEYDKAFSWFQENVPGKAFIKEILAKGPDSYNVLKLKKELNAYLHSLESEQKEQKVSTMPAKVATFRKTTTSKKENAFRQHKEDVEDLIDERVEDIIDERVEELQEEIESLRLQISQQPEEKFEISDEDDLDEKWKPLYKEANHYFSLLEYEPEEEKRKEIAFHILNLMDEVQKIWEAKNFRQKHGQLPNFESQGIDQLSVDQMATRIRTLRTYISKAKKGILNADKIPDWESEMQELERRVKG